MISANLVNDLTSIPVVRRLLKWYAGRYEEGSVARIPSGHAAGMKWKRHHRHVNGYWTGVYEPELQKALAGLLRPGMVFYDIGANAGFFTVLAAKLVADRGRVISFEPLPENAESVRAQIEINNLVHCELITAAVSDRRGTSFFVFGENNSQSQLSEDGIDPFSGDKTEFRVETVKLDEFIESHPRPDVIKIDVEGAETEVLAGADELLRVANRPALIIELHGETKAIAVHQMLTDCGYAIRDLEGQRLLDGMHGCGHIVATSDVAVLGS
ncbi:MAG TPA: FkbM family methyltransferase [Blastocatellia bacterium]|nr:FkbM family methyltransferase [Blastocatellia bacterium]